MFLERAFIFTGFASVTPRLSTLGRQGLCLYERGASNPHDTGASVRSASGERQPLTTGAFGSRAWACPAPGPALGPLLTLATSRLPGGGSGRLLVPAHVAPFPVRPPPPALGSGPGPHLRIPNVPPGRHSGSNRPRSGF